ncbi:MAG: iron-sulfur cluster assembly protein, partial [Gammaproteobacteria bacterium]
MADPNNAVEAVLDSVVDPYLDVSLKAAGAVRRVAIEGERALIELAFAYPAEGIRAELEAQIDERIRAETSLKGVKLDIAWEIPAQPVASGRQSVRGVKNIIAVASA